jgi:hypothetical protein
MEHNRVSLPCLGSFLSEYFPASISDGVIAPPSKTVVFHQNEIWNDEELENRIAQLNNVSIGVAKEELAFWIDNVCVLLATGEEVQLPGLGRLYVSEHAKLRFEQAPDNLLIESFGLESVSIETADLSNDEMEKLVVIPDNDDKKHRRSGMKGLIIGIVIIAIFAAAAILAIFRYIITDDNYRLRASKPANTSAPERIHKEYFTPQYGIVLSSFDKLRDARNFAGNIIGTSVYCIDNETPYSVIFTYPTRESADKAADSLTHIYPNAYIIDLSRK